MWGANGQGFAYLYVPLKTKHTSEFCALVSGNRMGWGIIASKQLRSSEAIPCQRQKMSRIVRIIKILYLYGDKM